MTAVRRIVALWAALWLLVAAWPPSPGAPDAGARGFDALKAWVAPAAAAPALEELPRATPLLDRALARGDGAGLGALAQAPRRAGAEDHRLDIRRVHRRRAAPRQDDGG